MRRLLLLPIALAATALAQSSWPEARVDKHGGSETKYVRNLNGTEVPIEGVEEVVLEDSRTLRIVQRTTTKYDANGRPGPAEVERIETRKEGETERVNRTVTRRDLNGNSYVFEISRSATSVSGDTTTTRTEIERITPAGRLEIVQVDETRLVRTSEDASTQTTTVTSRDVNGRFRETARKVVDMQKSATGETTITYSEYAAAGTSMALVKREVRRITGGGAHIEVDIYEAAAPGRVMSGGAQLVRRQVIDRSSSGGETVETTRVQPVGEDGKPGQSRLAERRVCRGDCQ